VESLPTFRRVTADVRAGARPASSAATWPPAGTSRSPPEGARESNAIAHPHPVSSRQDGDIVIDVRGLRKTYPDGTSAVKGVSFQVRRGEIFGFLGPNGAGKTTTMRILGTLLAPSGGTAQVLGRDIVQHAKDVRHRIGFAMQEIGLDDLATAKEMLLLHARLYGMNRAEARKRADELLDLFNLTEHADRRVTRFSGGMQRRLDLAVSLAHTPELLFLDEPSTGLDPASRSDLWQILRRLRREQGVTVMLSTHYMDEADALCDRVAIMNDGIIAAIDTPANLKRGIGADRLRIELAESLTAQQLASLQSTFLAQNVHATTDFVDIRVKDGARALVPALRIVGDLGVKVQGTRVLSPTLEDVFLQYTGARLAKEGA
jgi:ABC-2 type transport system ATP-binding protein